MNDGNPNGVSPAEAEASKSPSDAVLQEHHTRFAQQHGLPPPSQGIVHLGMVFATLGASLVGFAIGRRHG